MSQVEFDFTRQRSRREDPDTSKVAGARADEFARAHHAVILGSLLTQGAGTIYEIADRTGLGHVAVARRMGELQVLNVAQPNGEQRKGPSGRNCRVWVAI